MFEEVKNKIIETAKEQRENFKNRLICYGFTDIEVEGIFMCYDESVEEVFRKRGL